MNVNCSKILTRRDVLFIFWHDTIFLVRDQEKYHLVNKVGLTSTVNFCASSSSSIHSGAILLALFSFGSLVKGLLHKSIVLALCLVEFPHHVSHQSHSYKIRIYENVEGTSSKFNWSISSSFFLVNFCYCSASEANFLGESKSFLNKQFSRSKKCGESL